MHKQTIAVIAFNHISPFHLSIPFAVFGEDRRAIGVRKTNVITCCFEKEPPITSAGYRLSNLNSLQVLKTVSMIIVPSWRNPFEQPPKVLVKALRQAKDRGAILVGLCLGSYVLAAAGVLDNCQVTTHWEWATRLAEQYPEVKVNSQALYIDEGNIITSAGGAAGIDCCLYLMRRLLGVDQASSVARRMVVAPHRQGDQTQFIEQPIQKTPEDERLAKGLDWIMRHLDRTHYIEDIAKKVIMSRRTFTRHFKQVTGTSFGKWLLNQRLIFARRLLETTEKTVEIVAQESGFGSAGSLRIHFKKVLNISPIGYRHSFKKINVS